jgi:hypothetical protein
MLLRPGLSGTGHVDWSEVVLTLCASTQTDMAAAQSINQSINPYHNHHNYRSSDSRVSLCGVVMTVRVVL